MVTFSIITATYNLIQAGRRETFLQAVESVEAQRHANIEHIVVDGASTDGTLELLQEMHATGRIAQLLSEPDSGIYDAMNKGAALATGDYLLFLNSDDYYHWTDGLTRAAEKLGTGADFCFSPVRHLDEGGKVIGTTTPKPYRLLAAMPFNHPGLIVSRAAFSALGGFDTNFKIAGDYDFIIRLYLAGFEGTEMKESFVSFRTGGISQDITAAKAETSRLWHKNYTRFKPLPDHAFIAAAQEKVLPISLLWAMLHDNNLPSSVRRSAWHQLLRALRKKIF